MCGRFSLTTPVEAMRLIFGFDNLPNLAPRYNIAPGQRIAAVRCRPADANGGTELVLLRWGLVPAWAKDPGVGHRMINARGELASEKPSFREAFRRRRCLIPADGFYEWQKAASDRLPWFITLSPPGVLAFAGLWETWRGGGKVLETCTILTTEANRLLHPIHHRMPVILKPTDYEGWLGEVDDIKAEEMIRPYPDDGMTAYRVSHHVNTVRNEDPACIEPLEQRPGDADEREPGLLL